MDTIQKLALLQAYPLGTLEVETPAGRGRVTKIWAEGERYPAGLTVMSMPNVSGCTYQLGDVTPLLRPFAALTKQLPDGTIPAVEVARIQWPNRAPEKATWAKDGKELHIWERVTVGNDDEQLMRFVYIYAADMLEPSYWSWGAANYLRKNHFAVGLTPDQYIEKQD